MSNTLIFHHRRKAHILYIFFNVLPIVGYLYLLVLNDPRNYVAFFLSMSYLIFLISIIFMGIKNPYLTLSQSSLWIYHTYTNSPQVIMLSEIHGVSFDKKNMIKLYIEDRKHPVLCYLTENEQKILWKKLQELNSNIYLVSH